MPGGMSGVELAREVRLRHPELPTLLASGFAGAGKLAAEQDGVPILSKPCALNELAQAVAEVSSCGTGGGSDDWIDCSSSCANNECATKGGSILILALFAPAPSWTIQRVFQSRKTPHSHSVQKARPAVHAFPHKRTTVEITSTNGWRIGSQELNRCQNVRGEDWRTYHGQRTIAVDARSTGHCRDWPACFSRLIARCIAGFAANTAI